MQEMLTPERIATDMLNFCKSATLNGWNTLFKAQEQAEKLFTMMFEQSLNAQKELAKFWLSGMVDYGMDIQKEGIKLWQEWLGNNKKTREEFSKLIGESFDRAVSLSIPAWRVSASKVFRPSIRDRIKSRITSGN